MKDKLPNKTRIIGVRLSVEEYRQLEKKWKSTTCRKLSEYVRRCLFGKSVVTTYRDQSLDDFMTEMIELRNQLNGLGNNFNQAVRRLNSMQQQSEFKAWCSSWESGRIVLIAKVDEIKKSIGKIADKWLQE